jgi:hypothetical protein
MPPLSFPRWLTVGFAAGILLTLGSWFVGGYGTWTSLLLSAAGSLVILVSMLLLLRANGAPPFRPSREIPHWRTFVLPVFAGTLLIGVAGAVVQVATGWQWVVLVDTLGFGVLWVVFLIRLRLSVRSSRGLREPPYAAEQP